MLHTHRRIYLTNIIRGDPGCTKSFLIRFNEVLQSYNWYNDVKRNPHHSPMEKGKTKPTTLDDLLQRYVL